jgi:hypothetical protein
MYVKYNFYRPCLTLKCGRNIQRSAFCLLLYVVCITYEELNDLYSLPNIVRVVKSRIMRWVGHVANMGGRGVHRVLGKPEGKRPLG